MFWSMPATRKLRLCPETQGSVLVCCQCVLPTCWNATYITPAPVAQAGALYRATRGLARALMTGWPAVTREDSVKVAVVETVAVAV